MEIKSIGRYQIIRQLGSGGMSVVYLAIDPVLERHVAIKVLSRQFVVDSHFLARFQREAAVVASLEHASIVPVYDYGDAPVGPYIVMRLMTGGSLRDRFRRSAITLAEAKAILQRICSALDKAHAHNVIHRDIKPENILFDEEGVAYLTDFGIARLVEGTQTASIIGTPHYMAPEQAHGTDLNAQTDVYQMGVVLFEMLAGRTPYTADNPTAILYRHVHAEIPNVRKLNPSLPEGCEQVINMALAKRGPERFPSAGLLSRAFSDILADGTEKAKGQSSIETLSNASRHEPARLRKVVLTAGILLFGFLSGLLLLSAVLQFISGRNMEDVTPSRIAGVLDITTQIVDEDTIIDTPVSTGVTIVSTQSPTRQPPVTPSLAPTSNTPTATPFITPLSTVPPEPIVAYLPLSLDTIANTTLDYIDIAAQEKTVDDIPFTISNQIFKSQASPAPNDAYPVSARLEVALEHARVVHLLINSGNGFVQYAGMVIGELRAECGAVETTFASLQLGRDVREWHAAANVVSEASRTQQVWSGPVSGFLDAVGYIDMVSFQLPTVCANGTLTALEIIDISVQEVGSLDPALNLLAITVETSN